MEKSLYVLEDQNIPIPIVFSCFWIPIASFDLEAFCADLIDVEVFDFEIKATPVLNRTHTGPPITDQIVPILSPSQEGLHEVLSRQAELANGIVVIMFSFGFLQ